MEKIGFIGLGVMGRWMARHLLEAGYPLIVYTRTPAKAQPLLDAGAKWGKTPALVAQACTVLISMVGLPSDVESVYLGSEGVLSSMQPGSLALDMTTSSPVLAQNIYEAARKRQIAALDAP